MRQIGAAEAKDTFSALLDLVEQGEEIVITRQGRAVARLVKETSPDHSEFRIAATRKHFWDLAREADLGPFNWDEWKRNRDDGRR